MLIIHRYDVPESTRFSLDLPVGAKILTPVGTYIWALVDTEATSTETHYFLLTDDSTAPINEPMENLNYIGGFNPYGNVYAHIFELIKKK